ncbi:MAG: hypothetical protein HYV09_34570 [Deltaproteobacteria bacterium]|nr:hypothetical protein [Deltaproteobacteria bacterium]
MPNDQVEWVSLEDVMVAAEQGLAPIGPELAGFVVLEAVLRLRDMGGGGVLDATNLAIGTSGHVALTANPRAGDEPLATRTLRALLASLLEVSTSSTPALRQCARRKDHLTFSFLARELEGALIPLNRAASRRAVARLSRATLEAIGNGLLDPGAAGSREVSEASEDPPAVEVPMRPRSEPPPLPRRPAAQAAPSSHATLAEVPDVERLGASDDVIAADDVSAASDVSAAGDVGAAGNVGAADEHEAPLAAEEIAPPAPAVAAPQEVVEAAPPVEIAAVEAQSAAPPVEEREPTPIPAEVDDKTPFCAPVFELTPRAALAVMTDALEAQGPADIEIVSQLPPIVSARPPEVAAPANDPAPVFAVTVQRPDRVAQLIESFEVSRRRDDPALARDIKGWIGIETATSAPPPVKVNVKLRPRVDFDHDITIDHDTPRGTVSAVPVDVDGPAPRRGSLLAVLAVAVIAGATGMVAAKPSMLDAVFGPPLPPPGDLPTAPALGAQPGLAPAAAPKVPTVCEASLAVDGVGAGSELLRRIGATPVTVTMPMHVPLDLVATMDGHAPRRAHVDASAIWKKEPTGERLDVPFALDASTSHAWPVSNGVVPLRAAPDATRGLLRATSTPNGATLWVVVDPAAVSGVPCGAPVDLMVVPPSGTTRTLRVEWSAFTGSPPHAAARL